MIVEGQGRRTTEKKASHSVGNLHNVLNESMDNRNNRTFQVERNHNNRMNQSYGNLSNMNRSTFVNNKAQLDGSIMFEKKSNIKQSR